MQIIITITYHNTPNRMVIITIKNICNNSVGEDVENLELSYGATGNVKMVQLFEK